MLKRAVMVKAIVFDKEDNMLLIRRSKTAPRRSLEWDIPGGFLDDDDGSYLEGCLRELREEAGIEALKDTIQLAFAESIIEELYKSDSYDVTRLYFTMKAAATDIKLSYEHDEFTWVTLDQALQLSTYDKQLRAFEYVHRSRELAEKK